MKTWIICLTIALIGCSLFIGRQAVVIEALESDLLTANSRKEEYKAFAESMGAWDKTYLESYKEYSRCMLEKSHIEDSLRRLLK